MDVFEVHERVIADYRSFTSGFVEVRDRRIRAFVEEQFAAGVQWPDPWLSLNPSFATGGAVPELVAEGLLHPECGRISGARTTRATPAVTRLCCIAISVRRSRWPGPARVTS
jgi:hypothetical protein